MKTSIWKTVALLLATTLIAVSTQAQQSGTRQSRIRNLPRGLTDAKVRRHVIAPSHVRNIQHEEVDEAREVKFIIPIRQTTFTSAPRLDLEAFGVAIHTVLKDNVTGYMLEVRKNGNIVFAGIWNWAQTPADQNRPWNENTRMHLASVSKFLTAVALVKLLDSKGISYDAKIVDFLPTHWSKGNNVDQITFRHLLTHRSGFVTADGSTNYAFMKGKVAAGVTNVGASNYENMNFGLARILIPIINGNISKGASFIGDPSLNDQAWDAVTLFHYKRYMQNRVFTPAGVNNVDFKPSPTGRKALAYKFPHNNIDGWDSGDLSAVAGGAGWRLSTTGLLNVMDHVRRKNTIITAAKAQLMLDNRFGIDQITNTPAGKIYNKNGAWGSFCDANEKNCKTEQCVAFFFPDGMEAVLFVNSPIGSSGFSLREIVKDAFRSSLTN